MAYPMKLIQVILYLTSVSLLVHCRTIQRDLNTFAKISKRNLDCNSNDSEEVMDMRKFNDIFIDISTNNDSKGIDISDDTVR